MPSVRKYMRANGAGTRDGSSYSNACQDWGQLQAILAAEPQACDVYIDGKFDVKQMQLNNSLTGVHGWRLLPYNADSPPIFHMMEVLGGGSSDWVEVSWTDATGGGATKAETGLWRSNAPIRAAGTSFSVGRVWCGNWDVLGSFSEVFNQCEIAEAGASSTFQELYIGRPGHEWSQRHPAVPGKIQDYLYIACPKNPFSLFGGVTFVKTGWGIPWYLGVTGCNDWYIDPLVISDGLRTGIRVSGNCSGFNLQSTILRHSFYDNAILLSNGTLTNSTIAPHIDTKRRNVAFYSTDGSVNGGTSDTVHPGHNQGQGHGIFIGTDAVVSGLSIVGRDAYGSSTYIYDVSHGGISCGIGTYSKIVCEPNVRFDFANAPYARAFAMITAAGHLKDSIFGGFIRNQPTRSQICGSNILIQGIDYDAGRLDLNGGKYSDVYTLRFGGTTNKYNTCQALSVYADNMQSDCDNVRISNNTFRNCPAAETLLFETYTGTATFSGALSVTDNVFVAPAVAQIARGSSNWAPSGEPFVARHWFGQAQPESKITYANNATFGYSGGATIRRSTTFANGQTSKCDLWHADASLSPNQNLNWKHSLDNRP